MFTIYQWEAEETTNNIVFCHGHCVGMVKRLHHVKPSPGAAISVLEPWQVLKLDVQVEPEDWSLTVVTVVTIGKILGSWSHPTEDFFFSATEATECFRLVSCSHQDGTKIFCTDKNTSAHTNSWRTWTRRTWQFSFEITLYFHHFTRPSKKNRAPGSSLVASVSGVALDLQPEPAETGRARGGLRHDAAWPGGGLIAGIWDADVRVLPGFVFFGFLEIFSTNFWWKSWLNIVETSWERRWVPQNLGEKHQNSTVLIMIFQMKLATPTW